MTKGQLVAAIVLLGVALMFTGCAGPRRMVISTEPSNAAITVNEMYVGDSPVLYDLTEQNDEEGKIYVRASKEGYAPKMRVLTNEPEDFPKQVLISLEPVKPDADVEIRTTPDVRERRDVEIRTRPGEPDVEIRTRPDSPDVEIRTDEGDTQIRTR